MSRKAAIAIGVILGASGTSVWAETGRAVLHGTKEESTVTGVAALADTPQGLQVTVEVAGAPAGRHGLHIHEFGDCADEGKTAGGHYNPDKVPHGLLPKDGLAKAHAGDLGNIEVGAEGRGMLTATLPGVSLGGSARSVAGRALILHEKPDDFGQPTGNAGGRIGCGLIVIIGQ